MGNKQVREVHLMKYGAPSQSLDRSQSLDTSAQTDATWKTSTMDRLSQPRSRQEKYLDRQHRIEFMPNQGGDANAMNNVFPALPKEDIPPTAEVLEYPADWRLRPTTHHHESEVTWLYTQYRMTMGDEPFNAQFAVVRELIDKLLAAKGAQPVGEGTRRADVRRLIRSEQRFGILFDLIATRRCILTGAPHNIGLALYEYLDKAYPIAVKFAFVGITDNISKRVARDVFCNARSGLFGPHGMLSFRDHKVPFDHVDGDHMYIVSPGETYQAMCVRNRGDREKARQLEERHKRYFTPKYEPPPKPAWLQKIEERNKRSTSGSTSRSTPMRPASAAVPRTFVDNRNARRRPSSTTGARSSTMKSDGRTPRRMDVEALDVPPSPSADTMTSEREGESSGDIDLARAIREQFMAPAGLTEDELLLRSGTTMQQVPKRGAPVVPVALFPPRSIAARGREKLEVAEALQRTMRATADQCKADASTAEAHESGAYATVLLEVLRSLHDTKL